VERVEPLTARNEKDETRVAENVASETPSEGGEVAFIPVPAGPKRAARKAAAERKARHAKAKTERKTRPARQWKILFLSCVFAPDFVTHRYPGFTRRPSVGASYGGSSWVCSQDVFDGTPTYASQSQCVNDTSYERKFWEEIHEATIEQSIKNRFGSNAPPFPRKYLTECVVR